MEDNIPSARLQEAVRPRIGFSIHLVAFLLVNAFLVAINLLTDPCIIGSNGLCWGGVWVSCFMPGF